MDDKVMAKFSRKVEYLVRKRHRMIKHIMSTLTKEGAYWMNCVYINKDIIDKKLDAKNKVEEANTFYAFAISFGRIIDLGNVSNTVYCLLQLFEEYKCFFFFKMKEDPIDRL